MLGHAVKRAVSGDLQARLAAYANRPARTKRADAAVHECGHALAHLHVGVPFQRIVLAGPGRDLGPGVLAQTEAELRCDFWQAAVILWAGPHAEGHYLGASGDLTKIYALAPEMDPRDRGPMSPWTVARRLVDTNRDLLRDLATVLVRRGELSYDEFRALSRATKKADHARKT